MHTVNPLGRPNIRHQSSDQSNREWRNRLPAPWIAASNAFQGVYGSFNRITSPRDSIAHFPVDGRAIGAISLLGSFHRFRSLLLIL